jgi:hypothetical protein
MIRTRSSSDRGWSGTILGILPINSGLELVKPGMRSHESIFLEVFRNDMVKDVVFFSRIAKAMT